MEVLLLISSERHYLLLKEKKSKQAPLNLDGTLGRLRFSIPRNQLAFSLEAQFSVPQIANILGVSVQTVRRRMSEYKCSNVFLLPYQMMQKSSINFQHVAIGKCKATY